MPDMPSLIWHSNAPWSPTGYGQQTALFAPLLKDRYQLGISAFYGLDGNVLPWNGIPVYPGLAQTHGNQTILEHARTHFGGLRDGLVVSLMDVWVLDPAVWSRVNHAAWTPIDHEPCPPPIAGYFQASGAVPIAMSRFGERMLAAEGLEPLYVPHGIDTSVYQPCDRDEARAMMGLDADAFLVGMVAANKGNPSRKCFAEAFEAFKMLYDEHENARLYVHAEATGRFDGVDLPELLRALDLNPDAVYYCDQYRAVHYPYPAAHMAQVYSAMDVLLAPSAGEGFGIPVIEAQACGTPAITSDFSAQPELNAAGWLVEGVRHYTPLKAWQFKPSVPDIYDALCQAHRRTPAERESAAQKCREFALGYDVERVFCEFMVPALEQASERFAERAPSELKVAA